MKTLLYNGKIFRRDGTFSQAIGFDSESHKILFVGNDSEAERNKHEYDEVTDLKRDLVIPAFTDGHCHFIEGSYVNAQLDLREASCKEDFVRAIIEYRKLNREWIFGGYFTDANITDGFLPDISFLDELCPDVPVIVSRFDIHSAFANTLALKIAGLTESNRGFSNDELIRKNGTLTGELKELARDHVLSFIPSASFRERFDTAYRQMKKLNSFGIAAISDITLVPDLEIYKALFQSGKFSLRVDSRLRFTELNNISDIRDEFRLYHPQIKFDSLKAFHDGSLSSKTALMHSNYKGTDSAGMRTAFADSGDLEEYSLKIDKAGMQLSVHAIGDRSVTEMLDLAGKLNSVNGNRDRRFRIEHAQHIRQDDLKRFVELGIIASVQPAHLYSDAKSATEILEDDSAEHNYPLLLNRGGRLCFGTDFPVVGESPFETIYYAMTRKAKGFENGFHPGYCMNLAACLNAYTYENAYAVYEEDSRGSLDTGKLADIAVIDGDLFEMSAEEIRNAKVSKLYFGGESVEM